jgi:di/tricarboxylate transporter
MDHGYLMVPNAIVLGSGAIPVRPILKAGLVIDLVRIVVVSVLLAILTPFVL